MEFFQSYSQMAIDKCKYMKSDISLNYFIALSILISIGIGYPMYMKDKQYEAYRCETKKLEIKGVIDRVNKRANYMQARIKGGKVSFSLNIAETKLKKGFTENYSYSVGDSIIKKANSKDFTIKHGKNVAIYTIDCDD